jgi:hypothetical protein
MHVCVVTRNRSISATTLHTLMNINILSIMKSIHVDIHFVEDMSGLTKLMKTGERIVWLDYGTNIDQDNIRIVFEPFDKDVRVLVCPAVKEGIDWELFRKKTLAESKEPASQRGLAFDTEVAKKISDGVYDVKKTSARVWIMDSKPIDKKLRGEKSPVKLDTSSYEAMFDQLIRMNVRVAAATKVQVICHFIHKCSGNMLETPGVNVSN